MRATEIQTGRTYANAAGTGTREVLAFDNHRSRKGDGDSVRYRVVSGHAKGREYSCLRSTFAKWAASDVTPAQARAVAAVAEVLAAEGIDAVIGGTGDAG